LLLNIINLIFGLIEIT